MSFIDWYNQLCLPIRNISTYTIHIVWLYFQIKITKFLLFHCMEHNTWLWFKCHIHKMNRYFKYVNLWYTIRMELFSFQQLFPRSCLWLLDMGIYPIKDPRIWRYDLHCVTKATIDISTFLPSFNCCSLLLVHIYGDHSSHKVVYRNELLCSFLDVFLLYFESNAIQITKRLCYDDYYDADVTNGDRLRCNYCGLLLSRKLWTWMLYYA